MRKLILLLIIAFTCLSIEAQKSSGSQQRRTTTAQTAKKSTKKSTKKTTKKAQTEQKSQTKDEPETKPAPKVEEFDYTEILASQVPTVKYDLQAKKDPTTNKYGYENKGEKQYWWAEAHKLGKKKEELNSEQQTQWVISPQYDRVSKRFSEDLAAVELNGRVGFIDQFNRFIIEPQFDAMDDLESFHGGLAAVKIDGKYGFINKRGEFVIPPAFDKAENFGDDLLAVVKMNGKFGAIDINGDNVVPCTYMAKEIMTTVPIKNKPYKNAQKAVKAKYEDGYYSDLVHKLLSSEEHAFTALEDLKFMPVKDPNLSIARGSVTAINDGFYLYNLDGKFGIIDSYRRFVIPPSYKSVTYQPNEKIFVVEEVDHGDGKPAFGLMSRAGGWIIPPNFESLSNFNRGMARATVGEHSTNVDVHGLVESSFIEKMLKSSSEEKGTYYTQRLIGIWPTCAPAHNNMGIYYASSCDDLKHAINHFTVAHNLDPDNEDFKNNMKSAKSERNSRRWNRVLTGLQIAGTILTIGAMTYSAVSGNTVMASSDFSSTGMSSFSDDSGLSSGGGYGGGSVGDSGSSKGGLSEQGYREMYARWERNAKSCYESLTVVGSRTKDKKTGKDTGGSAMGTWGAGSYTGMKHNLRNAQKEMRKVRDEARRNGFSIPQSEYETINVSY